MSPTFRTDCSFRKQSFGSVQRLSRVVFALVVMASLAAPVAASAATKNLAQKNTTTQATPSRPTQPPAQSQEKPFHELSPQERSQRIEERIRTLHDRLSITQEQESRWQDVAQTMRDNEQAMSSAIDARRRNRANMSAIEDLQSYQDIAQTHVDGIKKMISAFQPLYDEMSDAQKREADQVFNDFEGRHRNQPGQK